MPGQHTHSLFDEKIRRIVKPTGVGFQKSRRQQAGARCIGKQTAGTRESEPACRPRECASQVPLSAAGVTVQQAAESIAVLPTFLRRLAPYGRGTECRRKMACSLGTSPKSPAATYDPWRPTPLLREPQIGVRVRLNARAALLIGAVAAAHHVLRDPAFHQCIGQAPGTDTLSRH